MQEQEVIIDQEQKVIKPSPVTHDQDTELFKHYEIRNWDFNPRIYKILAASAAFNILLLLVFAQTNILQARACDSPWVSRVCQVLDTVYVGSAILGGDEEFVSAPYEKTEIEEADIVWINQTGTEPLDYPEGYFALANPEDQFAVMQDSMMSPDFQAIPPAGMMPPPVPIPSTPGAGILDKPQVLPPPPPNQVTIPDSIIPDNPIAADTPRGKSRKNNAKPSPAKPNADETAKNEEKDEPKQPGIGSLPVADEVINKKPFEDLGNAVLDKIAKKEIDLSKPFTITMVGTITDEGKFDPKKSAYVKQDGDQAMINVAKTAIEAIGDSGILTYLKRLKVDVIKFELVQNDEQIYAVITSDQKTEQSAKTVSSGLNTAISIGKATVKEDDTLALLNAAKVEAQGRNFILNFKMEKPVAQEMINRQLQKQQAKRKQQQAQPSSTKETNASQKAGK